MMMIGFERCVSVLGILPSGFLGSMLLSNHLLDTTLDTPYRLKIVQYFFNDIFLS